MRVWLAAILTILFSSLFCSHGSSAVSPNDPTILFRIGGESNSWVSDSNFGTLDTSIFLSAGFRQKWYGVCPYLEYGTLPTGDDPMAQRHLSGGLDLTLHWWVFSVKGGAGIYKVYRRPTPLESTLTLGWHAGAQLRVINLYRWVSVDIEYNYRQPLGDTDAYHNVGVLLTFFINQAPLRKYVVWNYAGLIDSLFFSLTHSSGGGSDRWYPPSMPPMWPL